MNIEVLVTENFKKSAKKLLKKYQSLKTELLTLEKELHSNPKKGSPIGNDCYKIRLAVKSKGKGKSGGLRVLTHLISKVEINFNGEIRLYLFYIYDKSKFESISDKDLKNMIDEIKKKDS